MRITYILFAVLFLFCSYAVQAQALQSPCEIMRLQIAALVELKKRNAITEADYEKRLVEIVDAYTAQVAAGTVNVHNVVMAAGDPHAAATVVVPEKPKIPTFWELARRDLPAAIPIGWMIARFTLFMLGVPVPPIF